MTLLAHLHGHAAVLAIATLFHPAVLLWSGRPLSRGARWAVASTLATTIVAFALGLWIYGPYRDLVRHDLTLASPDAALLFETKEHLAWATLTLALGAGVAALAAPRSATGLRRITARAYLSAAVLGTIVCGLGIHIASIHGFT